MFASLWSTTLTRFALLYAAMYAAFGVASPFLPAFVSAQGVPPEQLELVLGAGTAMRLLTAPLAGRVGDEHQALRLVLVVCTGLAAAVTLGYLAAQGFWLLLGVSLLQAASLAPITALADALALGAASPPPSSGRRGFEYGWVRGTGSAAFIVGTLLSGQAVSAGGLDLIIYLQALLLGAAAVAAILAPELLHARTADAVRALGVFSILRQAAYARQQGLRYHYLGYWVPGSPSMDYKAQYRPHELLLGSPADREEPRWIKPETERPGGEGDTWVIGAERFQSSIARRALRIAPDRSFVPLRIPSFWSHRRSPLGQHSSWAGRGEKR